jgi:SAM-dependent methyltransferase
MTQNEDKLDAVQDPYPLGRSAREYGRLARQAELLRPTTQRLFVEAGIEPGMRVLDLGSGAGDVSMLLAEMVGPGGEVVGVDLDGEAIDHARSRVSASGFSNITFVKSDLSLFAPAGTFDAIAGRLVLMYQPDPAAALGRMVERLRPGGVVAFMEPFFQSPSPSGPDSALKAAITIITETLRRSGVHVDLGPRMHRVFRSVGLPIPTMRFQVMMDGREDSPLYQYIGDTVASLLPRAVEYDVPGAAELDVTSLPARLRAEMEAAGYAMLAAPLVTAWCKSAR